MADATPASAATDAAPVAGRPIKPDEAKYKADLEKAEADHKAALAKLSAAKSKVDTAKGGRTADGSDRWSELVKQQQDIRAKQASFKSSRAGQQDKFNQNENQIKGLIAQQKDSRSRLGYQNDKEIDDKIARLMKQVDSGSMSIVDEKKTLAEVSQLRKLKKSFGGLDDLQQRIDEKKAENAELKKTFDNAESRALADTYEKNNKEMDEIKVGRDSNKKNFSSLIEDKNKANEAQNKTWAAIKELKDKYYADRKAYKVHEDKIYQERRDKQRAERLAQDKDRRRRAAEARLEEASSPAYLDEILTAEGLIRYFDPSYGPAQDAKGPSAFAASAQREIEDTTFKGMKVVKKDEEDFFIGGAGKKKGKKSGKAAGSESSKLNLNIGIIEQLGKVGVDAPSSQAEYPAVTEKLKAKVDNWKKDQKAQTEKNIDKAKKEIERLEKEASETPVAEAAGRRQDRAKKVSQKNAEGVEAGPEAAQERDAVLDAADELRQTKLEEQVQPETVPA